MSENSSPKSPSDCPTREQLFAFSVGALPGELREVIASHIEGCAKCLEVLRTLDDNADPVIAAARKPVSAELFFGAAAQPAPRPVAAVGGGARPADGDCVSESSGPCLPEQMGDYRIEAVLGSGGMGTVYLAVHTRLGRRVALKVLRPEWLRDPKVVGRFQREMQAVGGLEHPNPGRGFGARGGGRVHLL